MSSSGRILPLVSMLGELLRRPRNTPEEVEAYQCRRLLELLPHAQETVPFYRSLYTDSVSPLREIIKAQTSSEFWSLFHTIPVATRQSMQQCTPQELISRTVNPRHLVPRNTARSSGLPLVIQRTWAEERLLDYIRRGALHTITQHRGAESAQTIGGRGGGKGYRLDIELVEEIEAEASRTIRTSKTKVRNNPA